MGSMGWLLVLGLVTGTLGAMVGVGGGFVFVPVLMYLYDFPRAHAAGTSLAVVTMAAATATWGYLREGKIESWGGVRYAVAGVPGTILGAWASNHLHAAGFRAAFAVMLRVLAAAFIRRQATGGSAPWRRLWRAIPIGRVHRRHLRTATGEQYRFVAYEALGVLASGLIGFIGGLLGIGGGVLLVPALLYLVGYPAQVAAATAQLTVLATALTGAVTHAWLGHLDAQAALLLGAGAALGGPAGVRLARHVNTRALTLLLSALLVLTALRMLW